ncbi:uncharacterized protein LOC120262462 isoform X2 [Dioscorea cayenensis subsp. rotundata]|uniref:Uncharacterized protein LOC120262462 isoform X2 n=1 Tax=Dioscorea cayennensis subsp. rotundata TaxID=55577 RepID=A0AB40BIS2_DIOCR|nr:uncharacterized protein LOC120262462 isoform X2 [Dioscorea cayenensis subsp. rotundata]
MTEGNKRHVLGDLTNKRKRPPQIVLDKFENQYKFGRLGEMDAIGATSGSCSQVEKEILTKGKEKVGSMLANHRIAENVGRKFSLFFNSSKNHGPLFPQTMKENLSLDLSQSSKVSEDAPCSLTPELLPGRSGNAAHTGKSSYSCFSHGCLHDQHNKSEDSSPLSEDYSQKSEELQEDYETDNADFSKHAMKNLREDMKSFPLNHTDSDLSQMKVHGVVEDDDEDDDEDDELLTQDLLGKSFSRSCLRPSEFDAGNLAGLNDVHDTSNIDAVVKVQDNIGFENSCSCSFCLKAAYMWMDLHYQDARGRLSALKKSRRYAKSIDQRFPSHDFIAKLDQDNSDLSNKLEFDLMQHWRSLFVHTENILTVESTQIQASLLKLKDLKEKCRKDLEMVSVASDRK